VIGIVDDAIVDVENITRHIEDGEPPRQAAFQLPVRWTDGYSRNVDNRGGFLPVALMGGVGHFKPFGITVSAAVIISCWLLVPYRLY